MLFKKEILGITIVLVCQKNLVADQKGIFDLTGNEVIQGLLSVSSTSTFSNFSVSGGSTISGAITAKNLTVNNETVYGTNTINGSINGQESSASIYGPLLINNNVTVSDSLAAGNFAFTSPPSSGTPGVPGFGGMLDYVQFYTQNGFTCDSNAVIPLDTIGEKSSGISWQSGTNYLTIVNAGTYLMTFYAVATGNNSDATNAPILLSIVINNNRVSIESTAIASGPETYNTDSLSAVNGYYVTSLNAGDTVSIINGGSSAISCNSYMVGSYNGVVANLVMIRIA